MIDQILKNEIDRCVKVLKKGGTILYPTDTIWGIGCNALNSRAIQKVYKIKRRMEEKSMIILLDEKEKLKRYLNEIPEIAWDLLEQIHMPLTVIYPGAKNLPKNLIPKDNSIAIRIVGDQFCKNLIRIYDKPIVSSSANISGEPAPLLYKNISHDIISQVDYVVNLHQDRIFETKPSTIIKLEEDGSYHVIRQ